MGSYTGEFDCKLDSKGRVKLPVGLLRQFPNGYSGTFIINKGLDNNLDFYTEDAWDKITKRLEKLNKFNSQQRAFLRAFYKNAVHIEMDASERILIPKKSCELIGLKEDAVIFCYGSNIEIWSKEAYYSNSSLEVKDFSQMADDIIGSINWEE